MIHLTRKTDFNLGYACNAECKFCYYYDAVITKQNQNNLTTEQAKKQLRLVKKCGIEEIEFTGGEATIRKDFIELVAYAKRELGFKLISVVTNGIILSDFEYTRKLVDAGMDDILFSVHGHNAEIHDSLTEIRGSFNRIIKAIENAHKLGIRVRTNTVICKSNYKNTDEIFQLLIDKKVDNINLVMFNPILQAKNLGVVKGLYVNYVDASKEIMKAIDKYETTIPHLNIRYLPYCYLPGYEKYITNFDQFNFEPDEWNNYISFRLQHGKLIAFVCAFLGILNLPYKKFAIKYGLRGLLMAGMGRFYTLKNKVKSEKCKGCAYVNVCDYIWKNYYTIYGDDEIIPVKGKKIDNPAWVMNAAKIRQPGELPEKEGLVDVQFTNCVL